MTRGTFQLKEFQSQDVVKLVRAGRGAVGSEMGSGKTHVAIACDMYWYTSAKTKGPTLIICPINVFSSWVEKYKWQSPDSDVLVIDRKDRNGFVDAIKQGKADVYIMHWDALRLLPELARIKFLTIIADEAHRASSRKSQATQALKRIPAVHKLALSGTLSGDQPQNLWSVLNWIWPKTYTSFWKFDKHYVIREVGDQGYTKVTGVKNAESLKKEMDPWFVRHLKKEQCCPNHPEGVMSYLPDKVYDRIWVELSPLQRRIYEQMKKQMVAWIGDHENSPLVASVAVAQMTRLSQIALATPEIVVETRRKRVMKYAYMSGEVIKSQAELETAQAERIQLKKVQVLEPYGVQVVHLKMPSSKFDVLLERLKDNPGKKFVVWSASKKMCYLISKHLEAHGIGSHVLSGDTPQSQRDTMVKRWETDDKQVFIGVIAAAGEGIDGLQFATDTAIFLDRSWSTKQNKQAEDRLHREGTKDNVHIIDIMAKDTIDLGRHTRLEEKWLFIKAILGDKVDQATGEVRLAS